MAKKLVILDADAIIELHQLKKWGHALSSWTPVVPESVYRQEAVYVSREFTKEHLTLGEDRDKGLIRVASAGISELQAVTDFLGDRFKERIHHGELEGLALVRKMDPQKTGNPLFCTGDRQAILALCCLDMSANAVSLQELIAPSHTGLQDHFCKERLQMVIEEGLVIRMEHYM